MLTILLAPVLSLPLFQTPTTAPVTIDAFLPENAAVVLRGKSFSELARIQDTFTSGLGVSDGAADPLQIPKMILQVEAAWDQIDPTKPFLIALSGIDGGPPVSPTLVLPCRDAKKFADSEALKSSGWKCAVSGDLVALSQGIEPKKAAKPSALAAGLDKADFIARIDIQQIAKAFGDEIEGALTAMEEATAGGTGTPMLTTLADGIRDTIESTSMFEINASQRGDELRCGFEVVRTGASTPGPLAAVDSAQLAYLARCIDPESALMYTSVLDWSAFMSWYEETFGSLIEAAPEALRAQVNSSLSAAKAMYAEMGPAMCAGVAITAGRLRMTFGMRPKDPATFVQHYVDAMKGAAPGVLVTGPTSAKLGDIEVKQIGLKFDFAKLMESQGADPTANPAAMQAAEQMIERIFGPGGMQFSFVERDGAVFGTLGGEPEVRAIISRLSAKTLPPPVQRVLDAGANLRPGMAISFDLNRLATSAAGLLSGVGGGELDAELKTMTEELRQFPPLLIAGGVDGRAWKLSFACDTKAIQNLASKSGRAQDAQAGKVKADIVAISMALDQFAMNNAGKYPDTLEALVTPDTNGVTYLGTRKLPVDPWKRDYLYEPPSQTAKTPRVYSLGADGKPGGEGENADVDSGTVRNEKR